MTNKVMLQAANEKEKMFLKDFDSLCYSRNSWQVWADPDGDIYHKILSLIKEHLQDGYTDDPSEVCDCKKKRKTEYIYCAVNEQGSIQWVMGSSQKTRYFRTTKYLANAVKYHNRYHPDDSWRVAKFKLVEVTE